MLTPATPKSRAYTRVLNLMGWSLLIFLGLFTEFSSIDQLFFADIAIRRQLRHGYPLINIVLNILLCKQKPVILLRIKGITDPRIPNPR